MAGLLHADYEGTRRLATQIDAALRLSLADRGTIRNTGAVVYAGSVNGANSDTTTIPVVALDGADAFAAMGAEDTEVTITEVTVATGSIAVTRASMLRTAGDLFVFTGIKGKRIDPRRLAASMVGEFDNFWMATLATELATATTNVGSTGVNADVDDFLDALYTLELGSVPGPWDGLIHPRQAVDWKGSLRDETGALAFHSATPEMMRASGDTLMGEWMGATWWKSSKITAAAGNREGALWGRNAVMWKNGTTEDLPTNTVVVRPDADIFVEFEREGKKAITHVIGHAYAGFDIIEQGRIVGIVTDQ